MPKVVTQRCLQQDLNLRPTDRKPKCLTVAPPRHRKRKTYSSLNLSTTAFIIMMTTTSGQSTSTKKAASPLHVNSSVVFTRWRQCDLYVTHALDMSPRPASPSVKCKHAPVPLSVCCWLADRAHRHPSLASPSVSSASQPRPPLTLLVSPSQTLVVLIIILIFCYVCVSSWLPSVL